MVESTNTTFDKVASVIALKKHYDEVTSKTHLRDLLQDEARNAKLRFTMGYSCHMDFTHTKIDTKGLELLLEVAKEQKLSEKIAAMLGGEVINTTEKRQVGHTKLREVRSEHVDPEV